MRYEIRLQSKIVSNCYAIESRINHESADQEYSFYIDKSYDESFYQIFSLYWRPPTSSHENIPLTLLIRIEKVYFNEITISLGIIKFVGTWI